MLALFPTERPDYSLDSNIGSVELITESRLSSGTVYVQVTTTMRCGDRVSRGVARVRLDKLTDRIISDRQHQMIVKQSFYRAAGCFIKAPPVWGSLTGIRPAKLATSALESGADDKTAINKLTGKYHVSPERAVMCLRAAKAALSLKNSLEPKDIALYVGIPFCPTRCAYCSFVSNSVEVSFGLVDPFIEVLLREIEALANLVSKLSLRIITVYIGGGTPTSLPPQALDTVMRALKTSFDLSNVKEYTVEAGRPDTINALNIEIMRGLGAGRICVNPQSMSGQVLSSIGRRHTPQDVLDAVRLVKKSGASLNMDVIAGLPGDSPDGFRATLSSVLELEPENVTVHTLSMKKGSRILLDGTEIPGGPEVSVMLDYASIALSAGHYSPYYLYRQKFTSGGFENTGWSRPGFNGIYNICMMEELCTVLSLGGGGVTKLVSPGGRIERVFNAKYPREYILMKDKAEKKLKIIEDFLSSP